MHVLIPCSSLPVPLAFGSPPQGQAYAYSYSASPQGPGFTYSPSSLQASYHARLQQAALQQSQALLQQQHQLYYSFQQQQYQQQQQAYGMHSLGAAEMRAGPVYDVHEALLAQQAQHPQWGGGHSHSSSGTGHASPGGSGELEMVTGAGSPWEASPPDVGMQEGCVPPACGGQDGTKGRSPDQRIPHGEGHRGYGSSAGPLAYTEVDRKYCWT